MNHEIMSERLFTLANGITAFAIIQTTVFVFAALHDDMAANLTDERVATATIFAGIAITSAYCIAVWICYLLAHHDHGTGLAWFFTSIGRTLAILAAGLIVIAYGDMHSGDPAVDYEALFAQAIERTAALEDGIEQDEIEVDAETASQNKAEGNIEVTGDPAEENELPAEADPSDSEESEATVEPTWRTNDE